MDGDPAEAEHASYYRADCEYIERAGKIGDICWEDAANDTAAADDGEHVECESGGEARGVGKFGDEEEWYVEADEAYE